MWSIHKLKSLVHNYSDIEVLVVARMCACIKDGENNKNTLESKMQSNTTSQNAALNFMFVLN